jgi:hypothetical protein
MAAKSALLIGWGKRHRGYNAEATLFRLGKGGLAAGDVAALVIKRCYFVKTLDKLILAVAVRRNNQLLNVNL